MAVKQRSQKNPSDIIPCDPHAMILDIDELMKMAAKVRGVWTAFTGEVEYVLNGKHIEGDGAMDQEDCIAVQRHAEAFFSLILALYGEIYSESHADVAVN